MMWPSPLEGSVQIPVDEEEMSERRGQGASVAVTCGYVGSSITAVVD